MVLLVDQFFFREICMCVYLFLIRESMIKYGCTEHSKSLLTVHCICRQAFFIRSICCVRESSRPPVFFLTQLTDLRQILYSNIYKTQRLKAARVPKYAGIGDYLYWRCQHAVQAMCGLWIIHGTFLRLLLCRRQNAYGALEPRPVDTFVQQVRQQV